MTIKDLARFIIDNGYPGDIVDFQHQYPNEAFCIRHTNADKWEVYYSERGQKSDIRQFDSESEACEYLKEQIQTGYTSA